MTALQDEIEAKGLWDLDSKVDQAMDALRCPPDEGGRRLALGRRAFGAWRCARLLLEQLSSCSRRAIQPSYRTRKRWPLGRAFCTHIPAHSARSRHPAIVLYLRQTSASWISSSSTAARFLRGAPLILARAEAERCMQVNRGTMARQRTIERGAPLGVGSQSQTSLSRVSALTMSSSPIADKGDEPRSSHLIAERLGPTSSTPRRREEGSATVSHPRPRFQAGRPAAFVGVIGPRRGKTSLVRDDAPEETPATARLPSAEYLCFGERPSPRRARGEQDRLGGDLRRQRVHLSRQAR